MNRLISTHLLPVLFLALVLFTACAAPTPTLAPSPATSIPPAAQPTAAPTLPTAAPAVSTAASSQPVPTAALAATTAAAPASVSVTWYGQSMFSLKISNGPLIVLDPVSPSVGYKVAPISNVDAVTVSHEHADHNYVALATGSPKILRGLAGNDWAKVDETIKGARIRSVNTFHDDTNGSARGKNAVFVFEANGMKIVHLGDLGHQLAADQIAAIGPVDVLMIPVGGNFTIDAGQATQVVTALKPRAVIPMHYKTAVATPAVAPVDAFLTGKTVQKISGNQITFSAQTLPSATTVFLLGYE
jgi:L-ascorbate metabolism protein UlaG (beta-lactamase superfamily)